MLDYFFSGGPLFMGLLSILFLLLIYSAIKNQPLIKGFGQLALAFGILGFLLGLFDAFKAVEASGGVAQNIWAGGLKNALLPALYGLIIYITALLIDLSKNKRSTTD